MREVVLEVRQAQCSHPDVHSSELEDILIEDFRLGPSLPLKPVAAFILGKVVN